MKKEKTCLFSDLLFTVLVILFVIQIALTQASEKEIIYSNNLLSKALDKNTETYNELLLKIKYATGE